MQKKNEQTNKTWCLVFLTEPVSAAIKTGQFNLEHLLKRRIIIMTEILGTFSHNFKLKPEWIACAYPAILFIIFYSCIFLSSP